MIERAFFGIAGPPRAGKTLLAERLLGLRPGFAMAGRLRMERGLRRFVEDTRGNEETRRYAQAGASETLLLRHPPADPQAVAEEFWETDFITSYSAAVVLEGAPLGSLFFDTSFFVMRPVASAARLLTAKRVGLRRALDEVVREFGPGPLLDALRGRIPEQARQLRAEMGAVAGRSPSIKRWAMRPAYADLAKSNVVIVNVRSRRELDQAERTFGLLRALWDQGPGREALGPFAPRRPPRMVAANLADDGDAALKRLLAAARRKMGETERRARERAEAESVPEPPRGAAALST
jgi:hypothetical protein